MKKYLKSIFLFSIIILTTVIISYHDYQKFATTTNNYLNALLEKITTYYPEIPDEELIQIINEPDISNKYNLLNKYGFSKKDLNILASNEITYYENLKFNFILMSLILMIISSYFIIKKHKENQEIKRVISYLKKINQGKYDLEIDTNSEGLISILKNEIYTTTIMLKESASKELEDKKNLKEALSNISHQLKTPLTSILILVDSLYDGNLEESLQKEFLNDIRNQIENVNFLIISMLKLSRFDANVVEFNQTKINVKSILLNTLKNLDIIREIKKVNIHISGASEVHFNGDYKWELEALSNIIKNCIEHTEENKNVYISYEENTFYTKIVIQDEGSGISKEEQKHIFERFYKGNNQNSNNFGIGLSLAKEIINHDNGTIKVESIINKGTIFTIKYYK